MEFDTVEGAKAHYKAYSRRIGFSMKANTSRRSSYTNVLEKQTFCCNKSGKPKINDDAPTLMFDVLRKLSVLP